MTRKLKADICVIGAGSGGLVVAAGAQQMGANVVLLEGGEMGGDCLNYGCVPSKALLAAGHQAGAWKNAAAFGLDAKAPDVDFNAVIDHVHDVIAGIAPHDSVERFEGLGVTVVQEYGRFTGPKQVTAGETVIEAKYFVVSTGSSAVAPPVPGLDKVPYLTNETIFENRDRPEHLIIIGAGPIGMEMAQAHHQLGARVTVLEAFKAMGRDDPEMAEVVIRTLREDGIDIREGVKIVRAEERGDGGVTLVLDNDGVEERLEGSHLLVAAGRKANVERLDLEKAGIKYSPKGIEVDARLRTTNKRVFAIGDVAGGLQFTHVAGHHAGIVIRNMLFKLPAKANHAHVPWVTYTDPELAWVGETADAARKRGVEVRELKFPFADNDRARAERKTDGFIKVITTTKGKILGAGIVGPHAGELIQVWVLALTKGLKIGDMAGYIAPYPTLGEVSKRVAGSYYTDALYSERTRKIVRFIMKFL